MREFNFDRLPATTRTRIETYAAQEGIGLSEALEAVILEVIGTEGLNRALAKMDRQLDQAKPRLVLVKPLDLEGKC